MLQYSRFINLFFLILAFQFINNLDSYAQINKVWTGTGAPLMFWQPEVTIDEHGNSFAMFVKDQGSSDNDSLFLEKIDSAGNFAWRKLILLDTLPQVRFSDNFTDVHVDHWGSPIVQLEIDTSGIGTKDATAIIKCNRSGDVLWQRFLLTKTVAASEIDTNGNIYVHNFTTHDSLLRATKLDSVGNIVYQTTLFVKAGLSHGARPEIDGIGNAWFHYQTHGSGTWNTIWYKINPVGTIVDSLVFIDVVGINLKIDSYHNVYVSNWIRYFSPGPPTTLDSVKSYVQKFDSSLNIVWDTGPLSMYMIEYMELDGLGNIYVMGDNAGPSGPPEELKVGKVNSKGVLAWIHRFGLNASNTSNFTGEALSIDAFGNPFVTGNVFPGGNNGSNSSNKYFVRRIDPGGSILDHEEFFSPQPYFYEALNNGNDLYILKISDNWKFQVEHLCIACTPMLSGTVFFDTDSSCTLNGSEHGLTDAIVEIQPGSLFVSTDSSGFYQAFLNDSIYVASFLPYRNYYNSCSFDTAHVIIANSIPIAGLNSGKYLRPTLHDLQIFAGSGRVRRGFDNQYTINYKNVGGSVQSGYLEFVFDTLFNHVQSIPTPDTISSDTLRWNFNSFLQGGSKNIYVTLNTPPLTPLGTKFQNTFAVYGNTPDGNPLDNVVLDTGIVIGSYDPNDKHVQPKGTGIYGYIPADDQPLHYTINFENLGNDTAFTVVVIDTLDSDLDVGSLKIGAVSHTLSWELLHSKVLRFRFDNILLADSSDPSNNFGFINYYIKQKPNLGAGTKITNTADIYFDFNLPISTNRTLNTIRHFVNVTEPTTNKSILVYPNPASDFARFVLPEYNLSTTLRIYSCTGQLVFSKKYHTSQFTVPRNGLPSGLYFYRVISGGGDIFTGKVVFE